MSHATGLPPPYKHLLYESHDDGRVILFVLNRPQVFNAVNTQLHRELLDAWDRFARDDNARVAVITGAGAEAFCSGADLKEGAELAPTDAQDIARHDRCDQSSPQLRCRKNAETSKLDACQRRCPRPDRPDSQDRHLQANHCVSGS